MHVFRIPLMLSTLGLVACAGMSPSVPSGGVAGQAVSGSARVILQPQLASARGLQAVVSPHSAESIDSLDVVPYIGVELEDGSLRFYPLSAGTGTIVYDDNPSFLLAVRQSSPSIDMTRPVVLNNLKAQTTYRFYARAYDTSGALISNDSQSYVDLAITDDDRPTIGNLPLQMSDRTFAGSATVTLAATGAVSRVKKVTTRVFTVSADESEVEVPDTAATTLGLHPDTLTLGYLKPDTTYRIRAEALDSSDAVLATGWVDVVVTDDDAPAPVTLPLEIPEEMQSDSGRVRLAATPSRPSLGSDAHEV